MTTSKVMRSYQELFDIEVATVAALLGKGPRGQILKKSLVRISGLHTQQVKALKTENQQLDQALRENGITIPDSHLTGPLPLPTQLTRHQRKRKRDDNVSNDRDNTNQIVTLQGDARPSKKARLLASPTPVAVQATATKNAERGRRKLCSNNVKQFGRRQPISPAQQPRLQHPSKEDNTLRPSSSPAFEFRRSDLALQHTAIHLGLVKVEDESRPHKFNILSLEHISSGHGSSGSRPLAQNGTASDVEEHTTQETKRIMSDPDVNIESIESHDTTPPLPATHPSSLVTSGQPTSPRYSPIPDASFSATQNDKSLEQGEMAQTSDLGEQWPLQSRVSDYASVREVERLTTSVNDSDENKAECLEIRIHADSSSPAPAQGNESTREKIESKRAAEVSIKQEDADNVVPVIQRMPLGILAADSSTTTKNEVDNSEQGISDNDHKFEPNANSYADGGTFIKFEEEHEPHYHPIPLTSNDSALNSTLSSARPYLSEEYSVYLTPHSVNAGLVLPSTRRRLFRTQSKVPSSRRVVETDRWASARPATAQKTFKFVPNPRDDVFGASPVKSRAKSPREINLTKPARADGHADDSTDEDSSDFGSILHEQVGLVRPPGIANFAGNKRTRDQAQLEEPTNLQPQKKPRMNNQTSYYQRNAELKAEALAQTLEDPSKREAYERRWGPLVDETTDGSEFESDWNAEPDSDTEELGRFVYRPHGQKRKLDNQLSENVEQPPSKKTKPGHRVYNAQSSTGFPVPALAQGPPSNERNESSADSDPEVENKAEASVTLNRGDSQSREGSTSSCVLNESSSWYGFFSQGIIAIEETVDVVRHYDLDEPDDLAFLEQMALSRTLQSILTSLIETGRNRPGTAPRAHYNDVVFEYRSVSDRAEQEEYLPSFIRQPGILLTREEKKVLTQKYGKYRPDTPIPEGADWTLLDYTKCQKQGFHTCGVHHLCRYRM